MLPSRKPVRGRHHDHLVDVIDTTTDPVIASKPRVPSAVVLLVFTLTGVAVLAGVRTGYKTMDVDEAVYRQTIRSMKDGAGYYRAMSDALVVKEGVPPSEARAIRPPTLFLFLRWIPEPAWRYVVGLVYAAVLLLAWGLGARAGLWAGVAAVVLAGLWVLGASSFLFLHGELWGVPLCMGGALAFRARREGTAAMLFAGATAVRELFALALLLGALLGSRRRVWLVAVAGVALLGFAHVLAARGVLDPMGTQAAFGNEPRTIRHILTYLSPGDRPFGWVVGVGTLCLGSIGARRARESDPAARLSFWFALTMAGAALLATRAYWSVTYGPLLASFAPLAFLPPSGQDGKADAGNKGLHPTVG